MAGLLLAASSWGQGIHNLDFWESFFVWANVVGASFAAVSNFHSAWDSHKQGLKLSAKIDIVTALYATMFTICFMWLMLGPVSLLDWSEQMRKVSLGVWILPWSAKALLRDRLRAAVKQEFADDVVLRTEDRLTC